MNPISLVVVSLVAVAVLAGFIVLVKKGRKAIALTILLVAALAVSGSIAYQMTRPLEAWVAHPNPTSTTDPGFILPKGKGVYQGRSYVFNTPLDKQEVFAEFKAQFPDAELTDNRAHVTVNGAVLELVFSEEPDGFDYTLKYVQ
jgi:hypothetical protein